MDDCIHERTMSFPYSYGMQHEEGHELMRTPAIWNPLPTGAGSFLAWQTEGLLVAVPCNQQVPSIGHGASPGDLGSWYVEQLIQPSTLHTRHLMSHTEGILHIARHEPFPEANCQIDHRGGVDQIHIGEANGVAHHNFCYHLLKEIGIEILPRGTLAFHQVGGAKPCRQESGSQCLQMIVVAFHETGMLFWAQDTLGKECSPIFHDGTVSSVWRVMYAEDETWKLPREGIKASCAFFSGIFDLIISSKGLDASDVSQDDGQVVVFGIACVSEGVLHTLKIADTG